MIKNKKTHITDIESETIEIRREVVSEAENPVMLHSVGKDSAVMLHFAKKAFYTSKSTFPLMHIDKTSTSIDEAAELIIEKIIGI